MKTSQIMKKMKIRWKIREHGLRLKYWMSTQILRKVIRISMNAKANSEKLSESEGEVFSSPKSSTSSWNVPEMTSNSEKERGSEGQSQSQISENDPGIHT